MHDRTPRDDARWRDVALVALLLLVGSLVPSPLPRRPEFDTFGPDKFLHLVGYGWFAAVLADALDAAGVDDRRAVLVSVGVSVGYGVVTGRLQEWVPGREPELADLVAGALGAVVGALGRRRLVGWLRDP